MRSFSDENVTIYEADCMDAFDSIPDGSVQLVFADPPYNIGKKFGEFIDIWPTEKAYAEWCYAWLEKCIEKLSDSGSLYMMTSTQAMPFIDIWIRTRLSVLSRIVWSYDSSGRQARGHFGSLYEPMLYAVKDPKNYTFNASAIEVEAKTGAVRQLIDYRGSIPKPYNKTKVPGNVWEFPRVRYRMPEYENHPTQKPEALLERIIKASTKPGDTVLDPFGGSFTTAAVAKRLQRKAISIERERSYIAIGLRRLGLATELDGNPLEPVVRNMSRKSRRSNENLTRQQ